MHPGISVEKALGEHLLSNNSGVLQRQSHLLVIVNRRDSKSRGIMRNLGWHKINQVERRERKIRIRFCTVSIQMEWAQT